MKIQIKSSPSIEGDEVSDTYMKIITDESLWQNGMVLGSVHNMTSFTPIEWMEWRDK